MTMSSINDSRVRSIVQRHLNEMSREIAQELAQPLLDRFGLTLDDLNVAVEIAPAVSTQEPMATGLPLWDKRSHGWLCPRCRQFSSMGRRAVTTHMRFCKATPPTKSITKKTKRRTRQKKS